MLGGGQGRFVILVTSSVKVHPLVDASDMPEIIIDRMQCNCNEI